MFTFQGLVLTRMEKNMMWKCNECSKVYMFNSTKRYRCKQCDFDICDHCKIKEEKGEI